MKRSRPAGANQVDDNQLIDQYSLLANQVGETIVTWMPAAGLKRRLYALEDEIKARGVRMKLARLLNDRDRFVRYYAAQELYGLLPQQCRAIIEENTRELDAIAGDARGFLRAIDEGTYKPE
jgi:hypothetical protein